MNAGSISCKEGEEEDGMYSDGVSSPSFSSAFSVIVNEVEIVEPTPPLFLLRSELIISVVIVIDVLK